MLDFNAPEFLVVAIVALVVIGPKDLPKLLRLLGGWFAKARGVARQFRAGLSSMAREVELAELEKQWAAENERIMREHPPAAQLPAPQIDHFAPEDAPPVTVEQPELRLDSQPEAPKPKRARKPKAPPATAEKAAE